MLRSGRNQRDRTTQPEVLSARRVCHNPTGMVLQTGNTEWPQGSREPPSLALSATSREFLLQNRWGDDFF